MMVHDDVQLTCCNVHVKYLHQASYEKNVIGSKFLKKNCIKESVSLTTDRHKVINPFVQAFSTLSWKSRHRCAVLLLVIIMQSVKLRVQAPLSGSVLGSTVPLQLLRH